MRLATLACVVAVLCVPLPANAQRQRPRVQAGWPCDGKVDPTYVRTAEATGGKVMLFKPTEITGAADEMTASMGHEQTVLRASGRLDEGARDFEVPLDSTIESAYLFISLQCLESVTVRRPSGEELPTDRPEVTYHRFEAIRLVTVRAPAPGKWTLTIAGRGFFSIIVKAKSTLALGSVSLSQEGKSITALAPLGAARLAVDISGSLPATTFQLISMDAQVLQAFAPALEQETATEKTYAAEITLPTADFRVLVTGTDENGFPVQRVTPRLFIGDR